VDTQTLNYSIVAVGIVAAYSLGFWYISAKNWFTGPVKQIELEGSGVDIMDPASDPGYEKRMGKDSVTVDSV